MINSTLDRIAVLALACTPALTFAQPANLNPSAMPKVGTISDRFQSYNIEMVEVTGGRFWKPYASTPAEAPPPSQGGNQPAGLAASLFEYRPPLNLANPRLRKLAAALGPAYVRVSGTWANTTFFQDTDAPAPATPPEGFKAVLTRAQWKGVLDFAKAADSELVTSFAVGAGTRDKQGLWTPGQAASILAFTRANGGSIAAAEFMNEPNIGTMGGAPQGYTAQAYARDLNVFRRFMKQKSPATLILGPGGTGEGGKTPLPAALVTMSTEDILKATGPAFDVISFHAYAGVSSRCSMLGKERGTSADAALSPEWLALSGQIESFYAALRDKYEPGKPLWNTETAQASCGGDRWASTFLDSFRYLNQLGISARKGVQVHMHNTLAASDYGLLDEKTYQPRPNYWAALLWRSQMGTTVLDPGPSPSPNLYLYAHCLRGKSGGVALLAINADRTAPANLTLSTASQTMTLTAPELESQQVELNGKPLELGSGDTLPELTGAPAKPGEIKLAPASITFVSIPAASNAACQ